MSDPAQTTPSSHPNGRQGSSEPNQSTPPNSHKGNMADDDDLLVEKKKLLFETYQEVLDATKHQDDKIGRLLTVVAFLTAAVLALANLATGTHLLRVFNTPPFELPYALIFLEVFLVGMFFTVVLLVTSFATPLRFPGLQQSKRRPRSISWANGVETSQIYFSEIARVSVDEWENKWAANSRDLQGERVQSLIFETHNLSVRTNFKYDRSVAGVAVFSVALPFSLYPPVHQVKASPAPSP
jgi:uncharacterized integral membrane protein